MDLVIAGWQTINTDRSIKPTTSLAVAGGLIRDENDMCKLAFSMNLGSYAITRVELRGAIMGLTVPWENGFHEVELQMDSRAAMSILP
ncbi:Putative ribonuclease H protein At1g65750 [Linum perenne]